MKISDISDNLTPLLFLAPKPPAEKIWQKAPAPDKAIYFIRFKGSRHVTLCKDTFCNGLIFGKDYEWSYPELVEVKRFGSNIWEELEWKTK